MNDLEPTYTISHEKTGKYGQLAPNAYFHSYLIVVEAYFDDIDNWNPLENHLGTRSYFLFQKVMLSEQFQIFQEKSTSR